MDIVYFRYGSSIDKNTLKLRIFAFGCHVDIVGKYGAIDWVTGAEIAFEFILRENTVILRNLKVLWSNKVAGVTNDDSFFATIVMKFELLDCRFSSVGLHFQIDGN
jgi:hypothetical protein